MKFPFAPLSHSLFSSSVYSLIRRVRAFSLCWKPFVRPSYGGLFFPPSCPAGPPPLFESSLGPLNIVFWAFSTPWCYPPLQSMALSKPSSFSLLFFLPYSSCSLCFLLRVFYPPVFFVRMVFFFFPPLAPSLQLWTLPWRTNFICIAFLHVCCCFFPRLPHIF